jgi:hypothetical protein
MDESAGGMTNTVAGFTGNDDFITKLGIAAMPDGQVGAMATDLLMIREAVIVP